MSNFASEFHHLFRMPFHHPQFLLFVRILESLGIVLLLYVLGSFHHARFNSLEPQSYGLIACMGALFYELVAQLCQVYRAWQLRNWGKYLSRMLFAWCATCAALLLWSFLQRSTASFPRSVIAWWFLLTPCGLLFWHSVVYLGLNGFYRWGGLRQQIVIFGAGDSGKQFAESMIRTPWAGYELAGFYDDQFPVGTSVIADLRVIGDFASGVRAVQQHQWQRVLIALPLHAERRIHDLFNQMSDAAVMIDFIPDMFGYELLNAQWESINGVPVMNLQGSPIRGLDVWIKRIFDCGFALTVLLITAPVLLITALLIKITSPGPIFFIQQRYGLNGQKIRVLKFRSLYCRPHHDEGIDVVREDPRVTPIGAFIRRTSIDEIPQFFNVLQGSMSVVGPRPHAEAFSRKYREVAPRYMQRLLVKPGITGWAQVNGMRGDPDGGTITDKTIHKRTELDLYYLRHWSIWLDLKIILRTIAHEFFNKNAY